MWVQFKIYIGVSSLDSQIEDKKNFLRFCNSNETLFCMSKYIYREREIEGGFNHQSYSCTMKHQCTAKNDWYNWLQTSEYDPPKALPFLVLQRSIIFECRVLLSFEAYQCVPLKLHTFHCFLFPNFQCFFFPNIGWMFGNK